LPEPSGFVPLSDYLIICGAGCFLELRTGHVQQRPVVVQWYGVYAVQSIICMVRRLYHVDAVQFSTSHRRSAAAGGVGVERRRERKCRIKCFVFHVPERWELARGRPWRRRLECRRTHLPKTMHYHRPAIIFPLHCGPEGVCNVAPAVLRSAVLRTAGRRCYGRRCFDRRGWGRRRGATGGLRGLRGLRGGYGDASAGGMPVAWR
jgi:hypothetical protein